MTLLNTVTSDMSHLVRQELVVALQWIVLLFESSFLSVALQEGSNGSPHQEIMSPVGIRRTGSRLEQHFKCLNKRLFQFYKSQSKKIVILEIGFHIGYYRRSYCRIILMANLTS